jgi:hypothetical protein
MIFHDPLHDQLLTRWSPEIFFFGWYSRGSRQTLAQTRDFGDIIPAKVTEGPQSWPRIPAIGAEETARRGASSSRFAW